jgi:AcrR family transcriptional regulator
MSQEIKGLRVRRTQKLLRDALIELIEEKGFDNLTVGEISERALVSRAAFYRYYQDKFDLVEQIFAEAIQVLYAALSDPAAKHSPIIWERFFEHISEYERFYRALLGRKGSPWFVLKMRASILELVREWQPAAEQPLYPDKDDFVPNLIAAMFVEAIIWWLEHGKPYTPQEMTQRCRMLVGAIFMETRTW